MLPLERQLTSPTDQQPVTRQATSPFDIHGEEAQLKSANEFIRQVGEKKSEFAHPKVKLIFNTSDATSLFVAGGGTDTIRIGDRIEVNDWAHNTGIILSFNGKKCFAGGSLASQPIDAKALKSAQRFVSGVSEDCGI